MRTQNRQPAHPGRILKNLYLSPLGVSNTRLAETLGVSRKAVSMIVNERKSVTPEMALALEQLGAGSAEFWLSMQANYDLFQLRQTRGAA